jgi:hypothetical protein
VSMRNQPLSVRRRPEAASSGPGPGQTRELAGAATTNAGPVERAGGKFSSLLLRGGAAA